MYVSTLSLSSVVLILLYEYLMSVSTTFLSSLSRPPLYPHPSLLLVRSAHVSDSVHTYVCVVYCNLLGGGG